MNAEQIPAKWNESTDVIVIGSGFAGVSLARSLQKKTPPGYRVVLISRDNFITFNPLLAEVVGASIAPVHAVAPIRQIVNTRVRFIMATVTDIDLEARCIHYLGEGDGEIRYEHLVLAFGSDAATDLVPGMNEIALPMKTLGDALFLRNRLMIRLEQAELQQDRDARRWLTSFAVIGGGFSGVEAAGEISDFLKAATRYYPALEPEDVRVTLIHSGPHLLPELPESLGKAAAKRMRKDGIDVRLGTRVHRIRDRHIELRSEEDTPPLITAGTVVNTIGTRANALLTALPFAVERGRLITNPDMSIPDADNVWALGDCAAVPNGTNGMSPPTAQFADRQGKVLAGNILKRLDALETEEFAYKPIGALSTVGHNRAVAEIVGLRLSGVIGFLMWRMVYLLKMPTLARKARVFLEWNWDLMFPQDIAYLRFARSRRATKSGETKG